MLKPGDRFDRYVVKALPGQGGMGAVYRALDERRGRRIALKVVHSDTAGTAGATARLVREARLAATLSHPNVVAIHDVGDVDGTAFIAMELVDGEPLRAFVGADVPLVRRIAWLVEIAQALGAAHAAGMVHRDIKPDNVMVREDGHVKVLDFGIARPVRGAAGGSAPTQAQELATLTGAGMVVGTRARAAGGFSRRRSCSPTTSSVRP